MVSQSQILIPLTHFFHYVKLIEAQGLLRIVQSIIAIVVTMLKFATALSSK